jgi:type VI secretion system secreted protein VgrG
MADALTQANRLIFVDTPLGKDKLLLQSFSGTEGVSQLFQYHLEMLSTDDKIKPESLIGQTVSVGINLADGSVRSFHGIVKQFVQGQKDKSFSFYQAEVVPALWLLTQTTDCRVFPPKTIPEIIEQVFAELNFKDFRKALTGKYTRWDYCVQYRETDFNFLSRIMEQEGIYYFFEHEPKKFGDTSPKKHILVLADGPMTKACPGQPKVKFVPEVGAEVKEDSLRDFQLIQTLRPGKVTLRDYHFEKPDSTLEAKRPTSLSVGGNDKLELYDYPGEYAQRFNKTGERLGDIQPEGDKVARLRMEEEEAPARVLRGLSNCRAFSPGTVVEVVGHPSLSAKFQLTGVQFGVQQSPAYASNQIVKDAYQNTFSCIPETVPARPARVTPKPVIQGLQNAVVVGASGKEIDVDKYGRVKVQFMWDRLGKKDENSSCWVRVAQFWAGNRWGAFFWPRIGQEVVVAFCEGDPEQPLIVGSVYNAEQMPPYLGDGLDPKHKHQPNLSGIKTNSTLGGEGYNELRFDDTKGKEQVFIHAQGSMDTRVNGANTSSVGGGLNMTVGGVDKNGNKFGDSKMLVNKDYNLHVKGDSMIYTEGQESHIVQGDAFDWYRASHRTTAANEDFTEAPKIIFEGGDISLKGEHIILDAKTTVSIKVGGNFIVIDSGGVAIVGTPKIKLNSGGGPALDALTSTIGSGSISDKAKEPKDPPGADSSKSGHKSSK